MANLAQILTDSAGPHAERPAILSGDQVISYAELDDRSARVASFLARREFRPGDRAGLMLANTPEFCVLYYGILRAGGVVVPMNPLLKTREVEYYLDDSGARLLLAARSSPGEPVQGAQAAGVPFIPAGPDELDALVSEHAPAPGVADAFGTVILEGYGLSETSPVASFNHPGGARKPGSIGTPVAGVEFRLVAADGTEVPEGEVGEIAIRGPNVMKGYWARPEATAEAIPDRWLRTGDLAQRDADGFYFIVDRKKDVVIRGGLNVYPREIEEVLYEHPAVAEAAVIGIPHETLGEEIGAAAALKPGASATPAELRAFVKERVAAYKYPRHVWLVDALPKGPTGKILRREVHPPQDVAR
ncbi:MAG: AMP-binding protein [Streptosporangiaceae bacterium]